MYLIPDIAVSLAAMAGLLVVLWHLQGADPRDGLTYRFRSTLGLTAVFLGARSLVWLGFDGVFRLLAYGAAACLPLMVFLLAEALVRRHAPLWAKAFIAGGAVALVLASLWPGATVSWGFLASLMAFQLLGFGLAGWLVWRRDPAGLSLIENARIRQISVSLVFILPFLVTDYRIEGMEIPVRLSGLAILVTCWLALSMQFSPGLRGNTLLALGWSAVIAAGAAGLLGTHFAVPVAGMMQIWAMVLALLLLFELGRMAVRARQAARAGQLLSDLAVAAQHPFDRFLDMLRLRASQEGALIVTEAELLDFDPDLLCRGMGAGARCRMVDLPRDASADTLAQSQLRLLLARYGAAAAYLVAERPLVLAVLRGGAFGGTDPTAELSAAFAMARLIAERDFTERDQTP